MILFFLTIIWPCESVLTRYREWGEEEEVGRQHQRVDRTGLEFKSQRAVENRKRWRELVAKSSAMPQQGKVK